MLIRRIISIALLALATPAWAEDSSVLKVVTTEYPPFEYVENGELTGSDVATVRSVLEMMGYTPRFRVLPWARAELMTRHGTADLLFSLTKSQERQQHYLFTDPISVARDVLYARKEAGLSWRTFDDLTGLRVGVSASYSYAPEFMAWLTQGSARMVVMNQQEPDLAGLRMVAVGRVDLFICEQRACDHLIESNRQRYPDLDRVTALPGVVGDERFFRAAFSKKHPKADALRAEFNRTLKRLDLDPSD